MNALNCPSCGACLALTQFEDLCLDACPACKGILFKSGQLPQFLAQYLASHPDVPYAPIDLSKNVADVRFLNETERRCSCCGRCMVKFNYSYNSNIILDRCPACCTVWCDAGETRQLLVYTKGNPKLEKLAGSMAAHEEEKQQFKDMVDDLHSMVSVARAPLVGFAAVLPLGANIHRQSFPVLTLVIILLNVAVWLLSLQMPDQAIRNYGMVPSEIMAGQYFYTLVTSTFLHGGLWHLSGNMFFLWIFGGYMEDAFTHLRYALFYMLAGVVASLVFAAANAHSNIPCIGASGAIAGVMGAYMALYPKSLIRLYCFGIIIPLPAVLYLLGWFLIQLLHWSIAAGPPGRGGVGWLAHITGFLFGLLCALPCRRKT